MNPNPRSFPVSLRRSASVAIARPVFAGRPLASRSSLGDPRFDRVTATPRRGLWDHALLDRLQSPLTRYHD